jgi:hypothetical protein
VDTKDYGLIKKLILEECVSSTSSAELSRQMGFKFDKFKRWLDNTKILRWDEFILLCEAAQLNLDYALNIIIYADNISNQKQNIFLKLKLLNSFDTNQEIADYLNCHPSVIQRHLIGKTIPDVETVFKMIDKQANMLASFIFRLFNNKIKNPFLLRIINKDLTTQIFEAHLHVSSMIQACISIRPYRERKVKTEVYLSEALDLKLEDIKSALKQMIEMEVLEWDGEDSYKVSNRTTNLGAATFQEAIPFYKELNNKLTQVLTKMENDPNATTKPGAMCARVYPASVTSMETIRSIILKAHADILKTLEDDEEEAVEACCLLLQAFPITKK